MKKEIILIPVWILLLILFLLINYSAFLWWYYFNKWVENFDNKNLTGSLDNFSGSIDYSDSEESQYNYDYIVKLLEEEKQKEEEQKDDKEEEKKNEEWDSWDDKEQEKKEEWEQSSDKEQKIWEQPDSESTIKQQELTPQELEQIKDYIDNLKEEEKYNREYFNNVAPVNNNPFFDEIFNRGEKDW